MRNETTKTNFSEENISQAHGKGFEMGRDESSKIQHWGLSELNSFLNGIEISRYFDRKLSDGEEAAFKSVFIDAVRS